MFDLTYTTVHSLMWRDAIKGIPWPGEPYQSNQSKVRGEGFTMWRHPHNQYFLTVRKQAGERCLMADSQGNQLLTPTLLDTANTTSVSLKGWMEHSRGWSDWHPHCDIHTAVKAFCTDLNVQFHTTKSECRHFPLPARQSKCYRTRLYFMAKMNNSWCPKWIYLQLYEDSYNNFCVSGGQSWLYVALPQGKYLEPCAE